jgi:hypothetical protein
MQFNGGASLMPYFSRERATRSILNYSVKSTEIAPYHFLNDVVSLDFTARRHLNQSGTGFA